MDELIYKTETDSQIQKTNSWLPKGKGRSEGYIGRLGLTHTHIYTYIYIYNR